MYQIKEITLQHGKYKRQRLIVEFSDKTNKILEEFLMTDAPMLHKEILKEVDAVLKGEMKMVTGSGNRTSWTINQKQAVIEDLFAEMGANLPTYPNVTIETKKLYDIMRIWFQARKDFHKRETE